MTVPNEWLGIARRRDVVQRSCKLAVIVGSLLIVINYADRLIAGTLTDVDYLKMIMTYCVPYCVSTYASVAAIRSTSAI